MFGDLNPIFKVTREQLMVFSAQYLVYSLHVPSTILDQSASNLVGRSLGIVFRPDQLLVTFTPFSRSPENFTLETL